VKNVLTETGKSDFLKSLKSKQKQLNTNMSYSLMSYLLKYKDKKYCITNISNHSILGDVLFNSEIPIKWGDIVKNTINNLLLYKLIKDYNIQI
jgi:hypothetical protein